MTVRWTPVEQRAVKRALLGSWPGTITAWGKDAFAAFIGELEARGLTAESVLVAVRTWPAGSDFPPSAPNLAAAARKDPGRPTAGELEVLLYGKGGVFKAHPSYDPSRTPKELAEARRRAHTDRALGMHSLVASFVVRRYEWLGTLDLGEGSEFAWRRREWLAAAWEAHCEASEDRQVAALVAGRRGEGLARLDPLSVLEPHTTPRVLNSGAGQ